MTVSIKHTYQSSTPDDPLYEVSSSEWNDVHSVSGIVDVANGGTGTTTGISAATQTAIDGRVAKAGDTMTGTLAIFQPWAALILKRPDSTSGCTIQAMVGNASTNLARWTIFLGNSTAEGGADSGSDFTIDRSNDAGASFGPALAITRSSGDLAVSANAYKPGGGPWAATSDARIKDVLGDYTHGLAEVLQLEPVRYTFKGNYSKSPDDPSPHRQLAMAKKEFVGLIAQQAEVPMPEMVAVEAGYIDGDRVDDLRVLDTTALMFALVNSCKELAARVAALETAASRRRGATS